jgi:signal transduction histidine kinase
MRLEPLDLGQVIESGVSLASAAAESANIKITVICPEDLSAVMGDARRLGQVLDNLMGNAIKFSPAGSEVTVTVSQHDTLVAVSIADQGIGISPQDLPHIWDRFYQVDSSATRRFAGSGLGLAIVKRIVEGHGGEVGVVSTSGAGSTFTFTLPLQPVASSQPA